MMSDPRWYLFCVPLEQYKSLATSLSNENKGSVNKMHGVGFPGFAGC